MSLITTLLFRLIVLLHFSLPLSAKAAVQEDDTALAKELHQAAPNLNSKIIKLALHAYHQAEKDGQIKKHRLTVIDYSQPSFKERLWVFDVDKKRLMFNTHVAHGKNSGNVYANHFSNQNSSKTSSIGTFVTASSYFGSKGYSLNLQGLEQGFNNNAYNRRIVIHGAWYMEQPFIKQAGRAGRSWGCPAVSTKLAKPIIDTIKDGSLIFAYFPDKTWLNQSQYV